MKLNNIIEINILIVTSQLTSKHLKNTLYKHEGLKKL